MLTTDADQTIDRLVTILTNEIMYHEISVETVTDVFPQTLKYLKWDIEKLGELRAEIKKYKGV